ncbi:response regulator [Geomonas nitrogeniifigens]|uniref:histidine kinase n=1 Tax=Geomonas diazotrophica TaxID=2843197 RepID=A0ABX8JR74_9BACT|nr:response regulator [Geomonas nitrogeniifigens]QWV99129.1 response regulator [Geomonas nitrogeniifigens]
MKRILLPTLKGRLAFWFTTICLVPLAVFTTAIYSQRVQLARSLMLDKLSAVTALRQDQINSMLDNLMSDVSTLGSGKSVLVATQALAANPTAWSDAAATDSMRLLRGYQDEYEPVADVSIVTENGTILLSTDQARRGHRVARPEMVLTSLNDAAPVIGEAYLLGNEGNASIDIAAPIKGGGTEAGRGAVVVRYNLRKLLNITMENSTGMGKTGEVVLVDRKVRPLVELRGIPNAVLKVKLTGKPAVMAAGGQSGLAQTTDYRGVDVLSAYSHIPRTGWGLVCKQDSSEVFAPIRHALYVTYGIAALISLLVWGFALKLAGGISAPLVKLSETANELGAGHYEARIESEGTLEQISLAASFNAMADTLQMKMAAQQGLARLSEHLVDAVSLDDFFKKLLPAFVDVTGARMATAFVQDGEGDGFAPVHAIGADCGRMRRYSRSQLEGELGILLTSRRITRFSPGPAGEGLRFVTPFGEIVPAELVTVPVDTDGELHAFVSLASEHPFPLWVHDTLEMVRVPLGSAFSRVVAAEDVRRLASELAIKNAELVQQSEELVQQSTELAQQSDELVRRNRVLDQQKQLLEEATRLKSEFLSNMSHELRTPLNSVLALSRVLAVQGAERLSEEERGYLGIIEKNGKHLLSLINDILDLAKIESGRLDLFLESVDPAKVAAEVVDSLAVLAREKGIALSLVAPDAFPPMRIDVKKLRQMLQNLVGNAVKFTAQGSVTVRLEARDRELFFEVKDTGIGIAPQYLESIFHEFRQADGSTSRSYEGTGLGLAIVKKSALLLGGDVGVTSELGQGSVFTLRLPLECSLGDGVKDASLAAVPAQEWRAPHPSGRSVLVVDDDPETVSLITTHLSQAGFGTLSALNGPDALRLARANRPFAITLDIMMPEMDGWEVMRELKEHPETADIPVMIISLSEDRATGVALGAVGVISKPVGREQLMEAFARLTGAGCRLVLVVDDSDYDRFFLASLFKEQGLDVLLAESGPEALELAVTDHPDLITLDLLMPGMDGAAVLDRLRSNSCTADIPVVVITSKELSHGELQRLSSGVSAIISKNGLERRMVLDELVRSLERLGWRLPNREESHGARILIVEDSEAATVQLRFALESAGYHVDAVSGGRYALTYLKSHVPDGIVLDLMMPEVDGFQVLEAVRSSSLTANVPVMVMTAKTLSPGEYDRLRELQVHQLVQKGDVELQELLQRVYEMLGSVNLFRPGGEPAAAQPPKAPKWEGDGSLLVVEDNPDNLVTLKAALGGKYRIVEACDGAAGLDAARSAPPSLILLDMHLPVLDGFAVLKNLKEDPATAAIPVVALTASAMAGDREKVLAAGCAAYLSKPYHPEELQALVESFFAPQGVIPV